MRALTDRQIDIQTHRTDFIPSTADAVGKDSLIVCHLLRQQTGWQTDRQSGMGRAYPLLKRFCYHCISKDSFIFCQLFQDCWVTNYKKHYQLHTANPFICGNIRNNQTNRRSGWRSRANLWENRKIKAADHHHTHTQERERESCRQVLAWQDLTTHTGQAPGRQHLAGRQEGSIKIALS